MLAGGPATHTGAGPAWSGPSGRHRDDRPRRRSRRPGRPSRRPAAVWVAGPAAVTARPARRPRSGAAHRAGSDRRRPCTEPPGEPDRCAGEPGAVPPSHAYDLARGGSSS
ncbi:hypothetical protein GCM10010259_35720 [Streptomyces daghestanicus]|uniref:Uncharacterized protein n=2 Tax=Streptomyces TaxID=1883 RepID=A0A918GJ19_STRGD|nr:hypothetical protein GCM10010238_26790 [Streptomyces niveoruber]GGS98744.1 hypothetical protein GCM10010240_35060 [Streptomyces griseoviridis]GGU41787.1 hypothetical protein GCM10010259_35720 [Streptomyces daghestanicus]GHI28821.1 hypothetical protein Sdagh_05510 [Streptomyces daghestanicus]